MFVISSLVKLVGQLILTGKLVKLVPPDVRF